MNNVAKINEFKKNKIVSLSQVEKNKSIDNFIKATKILNLNGEKEINALNLIRGKLDE